MSDYPYRLVDAIARVFGCEYGETLVATALADARRAYNVSEDELCAYLDVMDRTSGFRLDEDLAQMLEVAVLAGIASEREVHRANSDQLSEGDLEA